MFRFVSMLLICHVGKVHRTLLFTDFVIHMLAYARIILRTSSLESCHSRFGVDTTITITTIVTTHPPTPSKRQGGLDFLEYHHSSHLTPHQSDIFSVHVHHVGARSRALTRSPARAGELHPTKKRTL